MVIQNPYSHGGDTNAERIRLLKLGDPNGEYYMPAMSDAPFRGHGGHDWFWEPNREHFIYPLDDLMEMYYNSVGHNTSLILGLTPNPEGLMPVPDVQRLKEFGEEIERRFSNPVASSSGTGKEINLGLPENQWINQVVIQEDIARGERVRKFVLKGKTKDGWEIIFESSCIGHKFIHRFKDMNISAVRLQILESKGEPHIKLFEVFNVDQKI